MEGLKDILGIWVDEGTKFWLGKGHITIYYMKKA